MSETIRVLFVTDTFGYGGAEKQLAFVAEGLLDHGFSVGICNLNQGNRNEGNRPVSADIEMFVSDISCANSIKLKLKYISFVRNAAKQFKPDIIVGFKELANFCSVVVGKMVGVPSVISERADPYRAYDKAGLSTRLTLWIINHASGGVFQTEQAAAFYSSAVGRNVQVIPNPIFINEEVPELNYNKLPHAVVSLGRIANEQKRLDLTLEAFGKFHAKHPDYVLKIYGNGPDEDLVREWIIEKQLSDCVQLMGVSTNPIGDMSKEGVFLITSDYEGISNSLLEAMACGLPVVSTDHTPGGARLLINDGENGLLVPVGDVDAIYRALCLYAEDYSLAERCGKNARKVVDRFSAKNIIGLWEKFLVKMANNPKQ